MKNKSFFLFLAFAFVCVASIFLVEAQISRDRPIAEATYVDSTGTNRFSLADGTCAIVIQRGGTTSTGVTTNRTVIIPGSLTNTLTIVGGVITAVN